MPLDSRIGPTRAHRLALKQNTRLTVTQTVSRPRPRGANSIAVRQRPRRWRGVAAALLAFGLFAGPASMAHAAGDAVHTARVDAAAQPASTPAASTPQVTLAPFSHGVVTAGTALSVSVIVENVTARTLPATIATLDIGRTPIVDRAVLTAWQQGSVDGDLGPFVRGGDVAIEALATGDVATAGISVDGAAPELADLAPGVYPLILRYGSADDAPVSTSTMIVRDLEAEAQSFDIGLVVPVTAPALRTGLLTSAELGELTAPDGALTALLDAVTGTPAILAVDPAILAAIRVLGASAPADAVAWMQRLDALPNERFSTAFGDGDLATSFDAGLPTPFGPTTLQTYMQPADFIAAATTPSPTPSMAPDTPVESPAPGAAHVAGGASTPRGSANATPSPVPSPSGPEIDPNVPVFPNFTALLNVSGAHPGITWPATGTASTGLVEHLAEASADAPGAALVASGNIAGADPSRTGNARGAAGNAPLLIYDQTISEALRAAASAPTVHLRGAPLAAAAAQLAIASGHAEGPLLVTVDRGSDRTRSDLTAAIATVFDVPGATPRGLNDLLAAPATTVELVDAPASEARTAAAQRMIEAEAKIAEFATILDDPELLSTPERASITQLLGAQWRTVNVSLEDVEDGAGEDAGVDAGADADAGGEAEPGAEDGVADAVPSDVAWASAVAEHEVQTRRTLSSVGILPPSTTNLLSSGAKLQFWVRNDLPYPVNVIFITSPNDLRLEVSRSKTVTALPSSNTRVEVPVIAKVGSGDVSLQLELRSPTLQPIGEPVTAEVNVRADWEIIGIVSLVVIVGGLFVVGIVRTVLGRRRRAAAGATGADADADAEADADTDADAAEDAGAGAAASSEIHDEDASGDHNV